MKLITLLFLCALSAKSETIVTVIDNQIDLTHSKISGNIFSNQEEVINGIDDDGNGYIDDINGWNFIANSNEVFDYKDYGSFPAEIYEYYELRAKKSLETISDDELTRYKELAKNKEFMKTKSKYTKYAHGTHVACLALGINNEQTSKGVKLLPIRYLGDAKEGAFLKAEFKPLSPDATDEEKIKNLRTYFEKYAVWMVGKLEIATSYAAKFSNIINISWGQSFASTYDEVESAWKKQFESKLNEDVATEITKNFMTTILSRGKAVVKSHENILFIFSAGNKKLNNDEIPHYPSSIRGINTISTGAFYLNDKAYFSNFGKKSVSVFAPGMAVTSCVPENLFLPINGTSQAAPQVASLAANILERSKELKITLSIQDLRRLVLETSDKYETLKDISESSGVINNQRALRATELMLSLSLTEAIAQSFIDIPSI
ncbi:S8 family serine peptidase [Bacteriovorax sp. Seq25_V]|uniref:S8 family serine peptidase n=1 Tax=Bacteriovorax sp. Seq25_V TaxID=1201288 RepID=UPI00038A24E9|nr:S8 family serine peptidase [Bacteriovorax sp. Seq25_V]EQC46097.1 peptidase, S8/S53 family [Bacteriovorax sp. Seq25_V]